MTYQRNETPEPLASDTPAASKKPFHPQADYVLDLLVAAGHITREKAFQARDIAVEFGPDAAPPAPGAPAGFKLVPIEPTPEMLRAGAECWHISKDNAEGYYRAMLDAAPGAPGQEAAAVQAEPIAWESTTEVFKRFVTDRWYQKSSDAVKRWYKPYRCSSCAGAAVQAVGAWQDIATAPKHTEVLVWREDSGPFIAKLTTPGEVMTDAEVEEADLPEDFEEWWSDAYGWQEGSEKPTLWQPLPTPPSGAGEKTS